MKLTGQKNQIGEHYTPGSLAQFVVQSLFQQFFQQQQPREQWPINLEQIVDWKIPKNARGQIEKIKILDPGVGNGAFLLAAGKFLETVYLGPDTTDISTFRMKLLQDNLFGVDHNPKAVDSCRKKLRTWIFGENKSDQNCNLARKVEKILKDKIRLGNVLLGNIILNHNNEVFSKLDQDNLLMIKKKKVFHWYEEFPSIFNNKRRGFDLVLCNPPYVTKNISAGDIRLYRKLYKKKIFVNRFNLYHLFFARVNDLLAQKGIAAFLTSNSVLTGSYSSKIRDFIFTNFSIQSITDFVSRTKIFPNVLQGTCILILLKKNGSFEQKTQVVRTFDLESLKQGDIAERYISTPRLFHFKKIIPSPYIRTFDIFNFLRKNCILLRKLFKIQSGEIRPADKKIRPYYVKEIPENYQDSDFDIILNGKNISPYLINLRENRQKPRWYNRPLNDEDHIFREDHSRIPRIVFQRITAREQLRRVIAGKINNSHLKIHKRVWAENNINYILLSNDFRFKRLISPEALLGVFNSLLINWYMHQINLTAAIPPADLGLIPLPQNNSEKHDLWKLLHQKVSLIQKLLQGYSTSSEILTQLCPVCTSSGKIHKIQSEINSLVFKLYELPEIYQMEVMTQLSQNHQYFNHH